MTLASRLIGLIAGLPAANTYDLAVARNIPVPMPDGVTLLADRYYPRTGGQLPTILMRSPYGRGNIWGLAARLLAERGFQAVVQSCRGTFGSGGKFDAFRNERADGLATLAWLRQQPWFSGELATAGPSYLGFVQWAIAAEAGPALKAMVPQITASEFRSLTYAGEAFGLDTALTWLDLLHHQETAPLATLASLGLSGPPRPGVRAAASHLPLCEADAMATGQSIRFYQDWLKHNTPGDPWWALVDFSATVAKVSAPVHLIGGWYDIFLPHTLADYTRLRQANRQPYLTIGPWAHTHPGLMLAAQRETIAWFRAHLLGDRRNLRPAPVRLLVMGSNRWKDFDQWPPTGSAEQRWHLQPGRHLSPARPAASEPDRYRYNPADPTPAVGGTSLSANSGPRNNQALEARADVLTYSSDPLARDLEVIGPVRAELYVRSSQTHTDFFVRLCDVGRSGRSINVCDGLLRLAPDSPAPQPDGGLKITVDLWPTAHCFQRGHRLRVQVSSGAHPRYARNSGSGEPLATATTLVAAEQAVYHDPAHPSALLLPVTTQPA